MLMKTCSQCKENKSVSEFYRRLASVDGFQFICKDCARILGRGWTRDHAQKNREKVRAWERANPERVRLQRIGKNYTRRHILGGQISSTILERVLARDRYMCGICKKRVTRSELEFDHILPISLGGSHTESNLQVAHSKCNRKRGPGRLPAQMRF